jgi:fatty acid desaturase
MNLADPEALLLRQERERRRADQNRDLTVVSLAVIALLSFAAAVAGWWLYLAGKGCAGGAA